ncbi:hypothetical protein [Paraburkholderia sp. 35.1]|uniref:hypothetical protein n=1 Tax=Paraburkholderia sp. 35.1 TaxID=2991058 RepID=UPI003D1990EF
MKILIEHDTDEHGAGRVTVTGVDREDVRSAALDVKNATPIEHCPEVFGPRQDLESGSWCAVVVVRKAVPA